ncbi:hypothetical protein [Vreelandella sp. EE22]
MQIIMSKLLDGEIQSLPTRASVVEEMLSDRRPDAIKVGSQKKLIEIYRILYRRRSIARTACGGTFFILALILAYIVCNPPAHLQQQSPAPQTSDEPAVNVKTPQIVIVIER